MEDIGAAELLGTVGGLLGRHPIAHEVRPVIEGETGTHRMTGLTVTTAHGLFEITVKAVH